MKQKAYSMQCKALADDHKRWPNIFVLYMVSQLLCSLCIKSPPPICTSLIRRVFTLVFVAVPRCYILQVTNTGVKSPGYEATSAQFWLHTCSCTVTYCTEISIHMHCVCQLKFAFAITDHRCLVGGVFTDKNVN